MCYSTCYTYKAMVTIGIKLITFSATHPYLIYGLIALLALAEGPFLSIILGSLLSLGFFSFIPMYGVLMLGDLVGDAIWYAVGRRYGSSATARLGRFFKIEESKIEEAKRLFYVHKYKILFFSKVTNGLGFDIAILAAAGIVRVPFWKFIRVNLAGQAIWTLALIAIGYFFGTFFMNVSSFIARLALVGGVALIVIIFLKLKRRLERSMTQS